MILSHHGRKEFGSPIEPQIKEAEILHYLDMLDSKFYIIKDFSIILIDNKNEDNISVKMKIRKIPVSRAIL